MTAQPTLHTTTERGEKITLRPAEQRDVEGIYQACTDPETLQWTTLPLDYPREKAESFVNEYAPGWWQRAEGAVWVIADPSDSYAGQIDLRIDPRDPGTADVGFITAPPARGKGYMTAALRAAVEFGFRELGLARIEWRAHVGNEGSRRVAERVGFQHEGIQRNGCPQRGERHNAWQAAVIKEDFE